MLDILAILATTIATIYVLLRAVVIDQTEPWFEDTASQHNTNPPGRANFIRPSPRRTPPPH
jgi:hypothetical protein